MADIEQPTGAQQVREMVPDPYSCSCPLRGLLKLLGDLRTVFVIGALHEAGQLRRFKEISIHVGGIPTKMLTQTLRGPERDGFIERHQYPEIPPRVAYEFTSSGERLAEALPHAETWVTERLGTVGQARARYDAEY